MNGNAVSAGEYALFTIPGENEWTIILSTQTDLWGNTGYTQESDVLRTTVPATTGDFDESFTMGFKSLSTTGGELVIEWANTEVSVDLGVDSDGESGKNVERHYQMLSVHTEMQQTTTAVKAITKKQSQPSKLPWS
jgi:hypothetical protein